jgi:hypothetical protein
VVVVKRDSAGRRGDVCDTFVTVTACGLIDRIWCQDRTSKSVAVVVHENFLNRTGTRHGYRYGYRYKFSYPYPYLWRVPAQNPWVYPYL